MPFRDLYEHCQSLTPKIGRNDLKAKVMDITGKGPVKVMMTTLDTAACRGFYLSATNVSHRFVQQHGANVIVLARGLNDCWERFVFAKELMHLFDATEEAADSGDKFDEMLDEINSGGPSISPATSSEYNCFWMALASLCPENLRQKFAKDRQAGLIDDYAIALQLRVPQIYVRRYFEGRYLTNVQAAIRSH